jgi:protoporphyrinogen oxidase
LGGGLAGIATAFTLARSGWKDISVIEAGDTLGGLAGSFEQDGHIYPLGYHHILHRDRTLLYFLEQIGVLDRVEWRKIQMYFHLNNQLFDLAAPLDFLRFPMSFLAKIRFAHLMARSALTKDWSAWHDRNAAELVDAWAGPEVRRALFEPLCRLKFDRPCEEVSAAWLGARLHYREGSAALGYVPNSNWTSLLCEGLTRLLADAGVTVHLNTAVTKLHSTGDRISEVELSDGQRVGADVVLSAIPTEI